MPIRNYLSLIIIARQLFFQRFYALIIEHMWVCTGKLGALLLLFYMVFLRFVPSKSDRLIKYAPTLIGLFAPEIGLFVNLGASSFPGKSFNKIVTV